MAGAVSHCCPLCKNRTKNLSFYSDTFREYYRCLCCRLIFVPPEYFLSREDERAEYDKHQNSPNDTGYRTFLNRLFVPVQERLPAKSHGLDFGCGPGPTLSLMFAEAGHTVDLFDPFYANFQEDLTVEYDFITASEVVEHFHDPSREFKRLWALVKPGGLLGVMTKLALDADAFASWHYKNDPTHVCFFSRETMEWLGKQLGANMQLFGDDVILFRKNA